MSLNQDFHQNEAKCPTSLVFDSLFKFFKLRNFSEFHEDKSTPAKKKIQSFFLSIFGAVKVSQFRLSPCQKVPPLGFVNKDLNRDFKMVLVLCSMSKPRLLPTSNWTHLMVQTLPFYRKYVPPPSFF